MRICVLAASALLALATAASAADVHPSVSPSVLRGTGPWQVTYQLEFDSGPLPEQVVLSASSANAGVPDPVASGPVVLTKGPAFLAIADRFCSSGGSLAFESGQAQWTLALPANSVSTLTFALPVSRRFGIDELRFSDLSFAVDGAPLAIVGPEIVAPRAPGITLTAARTAGNRVALSGRTTPLLAGQRIDLRAGTPKPSATIGRVRVRDDGSFSYSAWRPTPGRWSVDAVYDSHDPRFVDSSVTGCFPRVQIGG